MKILQITQPGQAEWREAAMPTPTENEVLVKVEAVTTCPHWDLHLLDGVPMFPGFEQNYPYHPGQPGHEMVGEVAQTGAAVTGLNVGQRVAAWRDSGPKRQGCYAKYVAIPAENLLAIPETLAPAEIASLELAMCVQVSFDQLRKIDAIAGKRVGIGGLGPAGIIAVQMARAYGAREVVAVDPLPQRREIGLKVGADAAFAPDDPAFPADRRGQTACDSALDTTGLKIAIEALMARTIEAVAIFGVLRETIDFGPKHWYGGFSLLGYGAHNLKAGKQALQLILEKKLDLIPLVSATMPMTDYTSGIELLRKKDAIKILFTP